MLASPAFIAEMPPIPETSKRWWSMYCHVCGVEEFMARNADDPLLIAHRDEHNARVHQSNDWSEQEVFGVSPHSSESDLGEERGDPL